MERTYAAQVRGADEIKVCGFVENIRNKSKMAFIVLKDITGKVQITVEKGEDEALDNAVNQITLDSVITVIGKAVRASMSSSAALRFIPSRSSSSLWPRRCRSTAKRAKATSALPSISASTIAGLTCAPTRIS